MDKQVNLSKLLISKIQRSEGIILDFDETLVDLQINWQKLKNALSTKYFIEKKIRVSFTPLGKKIIKIKKRFGKKYFNKLLEIMFKYEDHSSRYIQNKLLIGYINEKVKNTKKIAIYSMNSRRCIDKFINKYLKTHPDIIISINNCTDPKPSGRDLKKIRHKWNLKRNQVLYLGNSDYDAESARLANIPFHRIKI